jgi:hypothetical protein
MSPAVTAATVPCAAIRAPTSRMKKGFPPVRRKATSTTSGFSGTPLIASRSSPTMFRSTPTMGTTSAMVQRPARG